MCVTLSSKQIEEYETDGFVVLGEVVGEEQRAALIAEEPRLRPPESSYGTSGRLVVMDQLEHLSTEVRQFCCEGAHLDVVTQLLGPNVALTHNQFVTKLPDGQPSVSEIPLHQDDGYGTIDPPDDLTVWVAPTDATIQTGCVVFVPRSHRLGLITHTVSAVNPSFRVVEPVDAVPLELRAGHAVAFSGLLLHGSGDNHSDADRVPLFARYCRPDVRMVHEGRKLVLDDGHSWMVRGQAPLSTWQSANGKFTRT